MLTYDPSVSDLATPMMPVAEASVETPNENKKRTVPIGLCGTPSLKKPRRISNGGVFIVD